MKVSGKALWAALGASSILNYGVGVQALKLELSSPDSIKAAAKTVAYGMMKYYHGNETGGTPGILPPPYYWWEVGAMFGQLIEYRSYTGDTSYDDVITQGMLFQASDGRDFMPSNQSASEGNDDQVFWAFAAMSAAETNFPNPPAKEPQWLALAQAVFNEQVGRWDMANCNGGLRWQIYPKSGWKYKNTISNGGFFQLAARLARYTQNETFAYWAEKAYDWIDQSPLVYKAPDGQWHVYDGAAIDHNCTSDEVVRIEWTYNVGTMISGAAYMYNYTNGTVAKWANALDGFLNGTRFFLPNNGSVLNEYATQVCAKNNTCTADQPSYKAYLARWLATTTQMAPKTYDRILPILQASALGAAASCSGGTDGVTCGQDWLNKNWDGHYGVGEQMSALSVISANLIQRVRPPLNHDNGGTSKGDNNAGHPIVAPGIHYRPITKADIAGATLLTVATLMTVAIGGLLMAYGDD